MNEKIRQDFPSLNEKMGDKPVVYFDNACMSLRPRQVIDAINEYYEKYPACAGRSAHRWSNEVEDRVAEARKLISKFIGAKKSEEIIFTKNTTESINLVANSLDLQSGDTVLISDKEHNSNLVPWLVLKNKKGIEVRVVPSREDNTFDLEKFKSLLDEKVKLVSLAHTSNLDGITILAEEIIKLAHKNGSLVMLDGAQSVPHKKINVKKLDVDFLAFSGHKMLGPSGIGVLYGKKELLLKLNPFLVGGDTISDASYDSYEMLPIPEKFEAGLQNYAGIIGLGEAVKCLENIGMEKITEQEYNLNQFITDELKDVSQIKIIGPEDPKLRGGIFNFTVEGMPHHEVAVMLDRMENIMMRSGRHCVHSWFNSRGISGSVRASFYFYNTLDEAEIFVRTLKKIISL